jgi:hypothetical protein
LAKCEADDEAELEGEEEDEDKADEATGSETVGTDVSERDDDDAKILSSGWAW